MFLLPLSGLVALGAAAGMVEARSVVRLDRTVSIAGLPVDLEGLRIAHVSDLHLGAPGFNLAAARRAVALVQDAAPDLIVITGDL
ncbi:MAG: metallophosphoesterase, partial [Thermoleophilia bacterium]|nr:metallophosphoesterase [Thermoleophilia bacterium]